MDLFARSRLKVAYVSLCLSMSNKEVKKTDDIKVNTSNIDFSILFTQKVPEAEFYKGKFSKSNDGEAYYINNSAHQSKRNTYVIDGTNFDKYVLSDNKDAVDLFVGLKITLGNKDLGDKVKLVEMYVDTQGVDTVLGIAKYKSIKKLLQKEFGDIFKYRYVAAKRSTLFLSYNTLYCEGYFKSKLNEYDCDSFDEFLKKNQLSIIQKDADLKLFRDADKYEIRYLIDLYKNMSLLDKDGQHDVKKFIEALKKNSIRVNGVTSLL